MKYIIITYRLVSKLINATINYPLKANTNWISLALLSGRRGGCHGSRSEFTDHQASKEVSRLQGRKTLPIIRIRQAYSYIRMQPFFQAPPKQYATKEESRNEVRKLTVPEVPVTAFAA